MEFFGIDWRELFVPQMPLAGIFLRGTMTYIMLFVILRFLLKRQSGVIGIADLHERCPCLHTQHANPNYANQPIPRSSFLSEARVVAG